MEKFYCPADDFDCPYLKEDGTCSMIDEGDNPLEECDAAYYYYEENDEEEEEEEK